VGGAIMWMLLLSSGHFGREGTGHQPQPVQLRAGLADAGAPRPRIRSTRRGSAWT
jgi:hypothetical protein